MDEKTNGKMIQLKKYRNEKLGFDFYVDEFNNKQINLYDSNKEPFGLLMTDEELTKSDAVENYDFYIDELTKIDNFDFFIFESNVEYLNKSSQIITGTDDNVHKMVMKAYPYYHSVFDLTEEQQNYYLLDHEPIYYFGKYLLCII